MDPTFWHQRWETNQLGFHRPDVHPMLARHLDQLNMQDGARLFLPLCGKTVDIPWLLSRGYRVAGAELSQIAVRDLFDTIGLIPEVTPNGPLEHYHAPGVDIFVGDIFDLDDAVLGPVDAVYDRAALVALPDDMRARYVAHLPRLTRMAPQLLITFDYDQSLMAGPPFSVPADEVQAHYQATFTVTELATVPVQGGLKGIAAADETVWLLRRHEGALRRP